VARRYRFVDCRWVLGEPGRGRELYLEGHVPGASYLDVDADLSDLSVENAGRHPLPDAAAFAAAASRAGIGADTFVVAYDSGMDGGAARLWWLLRHFGHDDAAVLVGGFGSWAGPLARGEEAIEPEPFVARPRAGDTVDADELAGRLGEEGLVIVDARSEDRYRGAPVVDPVGGRIPGALSLPYGEGLAVPDEYLDAPEIVAYCGSGVSACVTLLALARAGRPDARLYPGSWSDWSARGLPLEKDQGY
jgi:thiosulfate/3-mercaptopyruvate sulfurtransferase